MLSIFDRIEASLSWSYLNNSPLNLGAGLAYTGRGFQFYAVSDNYLGFFRPFDTRTINLRFGMNLMLACPKKNGRIKNESGRSMVPCPPGQMKRKKKYK
jgi:hypothetical protein